MNFSRILSIDCMSTCWEKESDKPAGQSSEIFCIDVAVIDTVNSKIESGERIIISPKKSKISEYCQKIFGISQSMVDKGVSFERAARSLKIDYMSKEASWLTWGSYDRYMVDKASKDAKVESPLSYSTINMEYICSCLYGAEISLSKALMEMNIKPSGSGAFDMANIFLNFKKSA